MNHQDWEPVVLRGGTGRRSAGHVVPKSIQKDDKPRGKSINENAARMAKLDADTENYTHKTVSPAVRTAIAKARAAKGMNRKQLAGTINVPEKIVADYETGKAIPDQKILSKMERALGVKLRGMR